MVNEGLADLVTTSGFLDAKMKEEYELPILEEQIIMELIDEVVVKTFKNLPLSYLIHCLNKIESEMSPLDDYELRDSISGKHLRIRYGGRIIEGKENIQRHMERVVLGRR